MDFIIIFFLLAVFSLLRLVYSDVKTFLVDERISHYMFGVVAVIFLYMDLIIYWVLITTVFLIVLTIIKEKLRLEQRKILGAGDLTILGWIIPGLLVLNAWICVFFVFFYCLSNTLLFFCSKKTHLPGTIAMAIGMILTWLVYLLGGVEWIKILVGF